MWKEVDLFVVFANINADIRSEAKVIKNERIKKEKKNIAKLSIFGNIYLFGFVDAVFSFVVLRFIVHQRGKGSSVSLVLQRKKRMEFLVKIEKESEEE